MPKVTISFSVDSTDRDLLRWLGQQPNRSLAIREAIRAQIGSRREVSLGDVYQAVQQLQRDVQNHSFAPGQGAASNDWPDEPTGAAAALDKLGEL